MKKGLLYIALSIFTLIQYAANGQHSDAHIIGHVVAKGEHLSFVTITVEGTTIGTSTDETGHFRIINAPVGTHTIVAQAVGYKSTTKTVELTSEKTVEIKFELVEDLIGLEQVVVSANRNEQNRREAITVVNALSPKLFESTQSISISEGLNFTPGLRLENNCQNCGFTQVRMNGMEGPYSQILINSKAIFSGLAGVYGLELYPANMVERVEIVRGGGSALYGSNAIAGTINLITKDPIKNSFEVGANSSLIGLGVPNGGEPAFENSINLNASIIDIEAKAGVAVFGFTRDRKPYDANSDDYSEISELKNTTIGTRAFHRTGKRGKVTFDYFNIREDRRGGNKFDYIDHEADIAESIKHNINTGALQFDQLFANNDKLSMFTSAQHVDRWTYYGAKEVEGGEPDLSAYGSTKDLSYTAGVHYYMNRTKLLFAPGNVIFGIENNGANLTDIKNGYYDFANNAMIDNITIADQTTNTSGIFSQAEWDISKLKASVGFRVDNYNIKDLEEDTNNSGTVFSPRISLKYDITDDIMARASYSQGYRAPQIFDEDLHIEVSGATKVIHENDPNLKQEDSRSYMASFDFQVPLGYMQNQWLVEGFYTELLNPFVHERAESSTEPGTIIKTRTNAPDGAHVYGVNLEWNIAPTPDLIATFGFTSQISEYKKEQEIFEDSDIFKKEFLRTPNNYGFVNLDYDFIENLCFSVSGTYTGKMLIPYAESEILESEQFIDMGAKVAYDIKLNGTKLQLSGGIKNMFNSYQSSFDSGLERDPGYVYGPLLPRTVYFGIKFFNL